MNPRKILAIDADNIINRAFHAIPAAFTEDGTPTNALRGFCNTVMNLQEQTGATEVVCAFDGGTPAFRKEAAPGYKTNRKPKPEELSLQLKICRLIICKSLGWAVLWKKETEADDLLHTMALRAKEARGVELWIASGDKDLAQCLGQNNPAIRLLRPPKKPSEPWVALDAENVETFFGVRPEQIADYLALTGDSCDNLPGVQGAGPKTVMAWLKKHGTLEEIIRNKENLKPERLRAKIDPDQLGKNKTVTSAIDTGHEIPEKPAPVGDARMALKELGLYKVAQRLDKTAPAQRVEKASGYQTQRE